MPHTRTLLLLLLGCCQLARAGDSDEWVYKVKDGDTLWSIARQHLSSIAHVPALQKKNAIRDSYALRSGSEIRIPTQWMRQHTGRASVTDIVGSASLISAGGSTSMVGGNDYPLQPGDMIRTAGNSSLKLLLEDGSLINIGPNAQFTVKQSVHYPSTGANATWLSIDRGSIDNNVSKNPLMPNRHTIQTPSAITAVRGTTFRVNVGGEDSSATEVLEGRVEVNAAGQNEQVGGGFGSVTRRGEAPGKGMLLPPPPDLGLIVQQQQFSPVILQWPAVPGMSGYQLNLLRSAPTRRMVDDKLVGTPAFYPALDNGQYQLTGRSQLPNGLQGKPVSTTFSVHAYPVPPLVTSPAPDARLRTRELRFAVSGSADSRYQVRLARDAGFSQPLLHTFGTANGNYTLPDGGDWYWQIARLDAQGQPGPYSQTYQLHADSGLLRASYYKGTVISARPYPLAHARYQLTLTRIDPPQPPLVLEGGQPLWQLGEKLFPGHYRVSYRVTTPDGYSAQEPDDVLQID